MSNYLPIYSILDQINVNEIPSNSIYGWLNPFGGNTFSGSAQWNSICQNGKNANKEGAIHDDNGLYNIEYHGIKFR